MGDRIDKVDRDFDDHRKVKKSKNISQNGTKQMTKVQKYKRTENGAGKKKGATEMALMVQGLQIRDKQEERLEMHELVRAVQSTDPMKSDQKEYAEKTCRKISSVSKPSGSLRPGWGGMCKTKGRMRRRRGPRTMTNDLKSLPRPVYSPCPYYSSPFESYVG